MTGRGVATAAGAGARQTAGQQLPRSAGPVARAHDGGALETVEAARILPLESELILLRRHASLSPASPVDAQPARPDGVLEPRSTDLPELGAPTLLRLQALAGNQAVRRLVEPARARPLPLPKTHRHAHRKSLPGGPGPGGAAGKAGVVVARQPAAAGPSGSETSAGPAEAGQEVEDVEGGGETATVAPPDEFDEGMLKALDAAVRIAKLAKAGTTSGPEVDKVLEAVPSQWIRIDRQTGNRVIRPGMRSFLLEEWLPARVQAMAFQMLDENKRVALAERPRYSGREGLKDVAGLRASAAALAAKQAEVERSFNRWAGMARQDKSYFDKVAEFEAFRRAHGSRFPILLARGIDYGAVAQANDYDIHRLTTDTASNVLRSIERTRQALGKRQIGAWDMGPVIDQVKAKYGIEPGSFADQLIERERKARAKSDRWKNIILAALQIGLTLAGAFVGGGVGAVLVAGSATIGAEQTITQLGEYGLKKAAAGSSVDQARAISADDPSLFWLAVTVAGSILDVGGTAKALQSAKRAFRGIAPAATDLRRLRKAALAEGKALNAEGLLREGMTPKQFADEVVAAHVKAEHAAAGIAPAAGEAAAGAARPGPAAGLAATEAELVAEAAVLAQRLEPLRIELQAARSAKERGQRLLDAIYESVAPTGLPKPKLTVGGLKPGTLGEWDFRKWTVAISEQSLAGALTPTQFAELTNTLRHELEHAVQWFRMARLRHLATAMTAGQLASEMQIPVKFARAAIKANEGRRVAETLSQEVLTATKAHLTNIYTAGGNQARKAVYRELDNRVLEWEHAFERHRVAEQQLATVRTRGDLPNSPIYVAAQSELISADRDLTYAVLRRNQAHGNYRALPEELPAHEIGEELERAVRIRGVMERARRAEYAAYERFWRLEQDMLQTLGTSVAISLKTQQAIERAMHDWHATVRRTRNLERRLGVGSRPAAAATP